MLLFKKIICPTDFSESSFAALETANDIAQECDSEIILVHVLTPIPVIPVLDAPTSFNIPSYEKEILASVTKRLHQVRAERISDGIPTQMMVLHGDPAVEIVRTATQEDADLIVIATHGLTGWRKFVSGSVTEKVVRFAESPVLSIRVRPDEKQPDPEELD
jgi:universal stress protein A